MTVTELLPHLEAVRARGPGKWSARCPAHADNSPSLTITEGDKGVLLKCWAGCSLDEITGRLGLRIQDLFFDALDANPQRRRAAAQERERARHAREQRACQQGALIDALREADNFVRARQGLEISAWGDERLDGELNALGDAYALLESEDLHG